MGLSGDRWLHAKCDGACHRQRDPFPDTSIPYSRSSAGPMLTHLLSLAYSLPNHRNTEANAYDEYYRR